ncbi:hypothetical protein F66182_9922 [Fusarium sp. NRRL 66182]|nr:hypothetical protein F66182_9922 [Fusarium sp. NRRL 66182]
MKFLTVSTLLGLASLGAASISAIPTIEHIAPKSKSCTKRGKECRTAKQAAPYMVDAFQAHGIYSIKEMAAVLALEAFETADFQYKRNAFPGRPGQGTANMQMAPYNLLYAKSIPELSGRYDGVDSVEGMSDDELNTLLDLVTVDKYNFGSGPWFLATQCSAEVREAFKKDADLGFKTFIEECVDTELEPRLEYFQRAKEAFGLN